MGQPIAEPAQRRRGHALSGLGMLDATNVSVGRGTATPFEVFGAGATAATKDSPAQPAWFDGKAVAAYLTARKIPGVAFAATHLRCRRRREPLSLPRADHRGRAPHRHRPRRARLARAGHRDSLRAASPLSHPVQAGQGRAAGGQLRNDGGARARRRSASDCGGLGPRAGRFQSARGRSTCSITDAAKVSLRLPVTPYSHSVFISASQ